MRTDLETLFFSLHRHLFGVCPQCQELLRLSDCHIFSGRKPKPDWMDDLQSPGRPRSLGWPFRR